MFGNVQGWIISAVMLLATAGALVFLSQPPKESASRDAVPLAYKPVQLPMSTEQIQPMPTEDCDAADPYYREAIDLYQKNPGIYIRAAQVDVSQVPAVAMILKGASCAHMHLFDRNPTQAINYNGEPWIDAISAVGEATINAALRLRAQHHLDEAQTYYAAAFELGRKLFEERVSWAEAKEGLTLMYTAAGTDAMVKIAEERNDTARKDACQHFSDETHGYRDRLQDEVASPLGNPVESYSAPFAGDVFAVAKNVDVEPMWRVEAIMHIGHYRYDVAPQNKGDAVWAPRELDALDKSMNIKNQDVAIKAAIHAAQNLTADQHHMTGRSL